MNVVLDFFNGTIRPMARSYRRNGTPIGDYKVYIIVVDTTIPSRVFEISGMSTYEEAETAVMLEAMTGSLGNDPGRIVLTRPGANLAKANLSGANLEKCDLSGANLRHSTLVGTKLSRSKMSGCNLIGVDAKHSNFYMSDLSYSKMWASSFIGSQLDGAKLDGVEVKAPGGGAWLDTNFEGAIRPSGPFPQGWTVNDDGFMARARQSSRDWW